MMCDSKIPDYTNRRKIESLKVTDGKSNEVRKEENEQVFKDVCTKLEECAISLTPVKKHINKNSFSDSNCVSSSASRHHEIEDFHKFLEDFGGHYGGWKENDHLFYLKIRSKYPLNKAAAIVNEKFPDINITQVIKHDAWYNEYLRLKMAKKKAIDEWKSRQKQLVKIEVKEKLEPKPQNVKRDPKIKEKIEIWKAYTLAAKLERQAEHQKEEMKIKKENEEKKKIQEQKRALVNQYKEEKLCYEIAVKTEKELDKLEAKKEALRKATIMLKYFRYEDRRFTERLKAKKQPKVKSPPKPKIHIEAKRDPNRLLKPTLGWIYHTKKNEKETEHVQHSIHHLPKLGKPLWRKGIPC